MSILEVENLSVSFKQYTDGFKEINHKVISSLSVTLEAGEILAVVGASGSGKSLLAHAILGILPRNASISGTIKYKGVELTAARLATLRGKELALVPQSVNFLDPLMRVGSQVRTASNSEDVVSAQRKVFERYHLGKEVESMYPFQLSGGMARRTLLSTAMVSGAKVIIADEPTPGLDPIVIKEALSNFREFADKGCAVMLITHDIESALQITDKIAVFYAGTTVEIASVKDFVGKGEAIRHPYTKALWRALPQNEFISIPGSQPHPSSLPPGCLFAPRCEIATPECEQAPPDMRELRDGMVRCIHAT
ncbi:peptide/nickel transport system ATP-binding protein [Psychrobacillus sp. OK028]|uniref:ABC transporter ATP-binding protein n=1 Tax=Psychrobacillus sp. OK028 TaxID=1884359 RepID=UPI000890A2A9|nr:ABC transporter ATP-binding protein [Psychrobacillus sp. OK028]SDN73398.1 peptide/nickel transport system ATP-binding protein [Psychrobacillus sp. OK028]